MVLETLRRQTDQARKAFRAQSAASPPLTQATKSMDEFQLQLFYELSS
jgi:hypothetical protein